MAHRTTTSQRACKRSLHQQPSAVSSHSVLQPSSPVIGPTLAIRCGSSDALLDLSRFFGHSSGACIVLSPAGGAGVGELISPQAFQERSMCQSFRDWQRSIKHHGVTIHTLLSSGLLTTASRDKPATCSCDRCLASGRGEDEDGLAENLLSLSPAKRRRVAKATTGNVTCVDNGNENNTNTEGEGQTVQGGLETGVSVSKRHGRRASGRQTTPVGDKPDTNDSVRTADLTVTISSSNIAPVSSSVTSTQGAVLKNVGKVEDAVQSESISKLSPTEAQPMKQLETCSKVASGPGAGVRPGSGPSGFSHRPKRSAAQKSSNHDNDSRPPIRPVQQRRVNTRHLATSVEEKQFETVAVNGNLVAGRVGSRTLHRVSSSSTNVLQSSAEKVVPQTVVDSICSPDEVPQSVSQKSPAAEEQFVPERNLFQDFSLSGRPNMKLAADDTDAQSPAPSGSSVGGEAAPLLPLVDDQYRCNDEKQVGRDLDLVKKMTSDDTDGLDDVEEKLQSKTETSDNVTENSTTLIAGVFTHSDIDRASQPLDDDKDRVTSDEPINRELTVSTIFPADIPMSKNEEPIGALVDSAHVVDGSLKVLSLPNDTNNNSSNIIHVQLPLTTATDDDSTEDILLSRCATDGSGGESRIKNVIEELRSRKRLHFRADNKDKKPTAPLSTDHLRCSSESTPAACASAVAEDPKNPKSTTLTFSALGQLQNFAAERARNLELQTSSSSAASPSPVVALATLKVPDVSWKPLIGQSSPLTTVAGPTSSVLLAHTAASGTSASSNISKSSLLSRGHEHKPGKDASSKLLFSHFNQRLSSSSMKQIKSLPPKTGHQAATEDIRPSPSTHTRPGTSHSDDVTSGSSKVTERTTTHGSNRSQLHTDQLRQYGPGVVLKFKVKDSSSSNTPRRHKRTRNLSAINQTPIKPVVPSGERTSSAFSTSFSSSTSLAARYSLPHHQHRLHHSDGTGSRQNNHKHSSVTTSIKPAEKHLAKRSNGDWLLNVPVPKVGNASSTRMVRGEGVTSANAKSLQSLLVGGNRASSASAATLAAPRMAHSPSQRTSSASSSKNRLMSLTLMQRPSTTPSAASTMRRYSDSNYWHQRTLFGGDASDALPLDYSSKALQELAAERYNESAQTVTNWCAFDTDSSGAIDLTTTTSALQQRPRTSAGEDCSEADGSRKKLSSAADAAVTLLNLSIIQHGQPKSDSASTSKQVHPCQQWL